MKQKFLKDIGIDIDDETKDLIKQFDLTGYMDQISDDRLKEEEKAVEEQTEKIETADEIKNDKTDVADEETETADKENTEE